MRRVFADSVYWIAVTSPGDQWSENARTAYMSLGHSCVWTTEEVLTEFLAALSAKGPRVRLLAVSVVERVFRRKEFIVLPQTHRSFLRGLSLYKLRPDKRYSLVDCISMEAMKTHGLREVLTNDRHFMQEGFVALMRG